MNDTGPSAVVMMTVEIELPYDLSDELQDAVVEDITYEPHIDRLAKIIKRWVRHLTGENCHISIDVE